MHAARNAATPSRSAAGFEGIAREAEWCETRWLDHAVFALLSTDPRPPVGRGR
ncbi:MAG: hypothetical protein R3F14_00980 [Polyangiaceae bacterium]